MMGQPPHAIQASAPAVDIFAGSPRAVGIVDDSPQKLAASGFDAFLNLSPSILSPAVRVDSTKMLWDPQEGFQAKIEALTGSKIPEGLFRNPSPFHRLDFSRAPQLSEIYLTTLFIRNDFSGNLLSQALKWHASRGARVRVLVTGAILRATKLLSPKDGAADQAILDDLARTPNVSVEIWEHRNPFEVTEGPGAQRRFEFSQLHRVTHAKILMTVNRRDPRRNTIIIGGRNISDAYVFGSAPTYERIDGLVDYKASSFWAVDDLEIQLTGRQMAEEIRAQLLAFFHRPQGAWTYTDPYVYLSVPEIAGPIHEAAKPKLGAELYARHFFFTPNAGSSNLREIFIRLIRSAKRSLIITSPYFHPDRELMESIRSALQAGVKITIVTNLNLKGDDYGPATINESNRRSVKEFLERAEIHSWSKDSTMLHAKSILVDDQVLYIGSVNLNRRSFHHDLENGLILTGNQAVRQYLQVVRQDILPNTTRMTSLPSESRLQGALLTFFGHLF